MSASQKNPLRALTEIEQQQLERLTKASSERIDVVRRAKALLILAQGHTLTETGKQAGISRQAVAQLVERFRASWDSSGADYCARARAQTHLWSGGTSLDPAHSATSTGSRLWMERPPGP